MSPTTIQKSHRVGSGPSRLPDTAGAPPSPVRALLAIVASAILLVGVPVALVLLVGNPLPTTAPSHEWLTADVNAEVVINVVAILVWIVWAHFVVCFLTEWRALRRGRMPGNVLFGGGSQTVARQLVAAILLLSGAASIGQAFTAHHEAPVAPDSVATSVRAGSPTEQVIDRAHQDATEEATPSAAARQQGLKMVTVRVPDGRHHDTLWGIAERTLGNPLRYKEIFELNKDKLQADGRRLVDADLIQPGWQLTLPADASGPDVHTIAAPGGQAPGQATAREGGATAGDATAAPTATASAPVSEAGGVDLGDLGLGGGLVLAGIIAALTARRGVYGSPDDSEGALRLAADPVRAQLLDRALRVLSEGRQAQGEALPDLSVVYLSEDRVIAHVAGTPTPPPAPWTLSEDGTSWAVTATALEGLTSTAPAPYPALVNIATSHGFDVLVDLEYASGLIALGGDAGIAREVVMSTVVDLATHAWSDAVSVTMVGFGDDLSAIAPQRITAKADLDEALDEIEGELGRASELLARLGVSGVLSGRATARHPELRPRVLALSAAPSAEQVQRIRGLVADGRTAFAAVCVGDAPGARWRFAVEESGAIDLGILGVSGTARRLTPGATREVEQLMRTAVEEAAARRVELGNASPAGVLQDSTVPEVTAAADSAASVRLLGPVAVTAPGTADPDHQDVLTELVVMAALHPDGLHETTLRSGLWPRGVSDEVVEQSLAEAVAWLGESTSGPRLHRGEDGRWHLREVYVDLAALRAGALDGADTGVGSLVSGLALVRGEVLSGTPAGRYGWLAFHRVARDTRALVVSIAARASSRLVASGRHTDADRALRQGLSGVPAAESLWRELIRLHQDDTPDGAGGVVTEMRATLPGHHFEAETDALVAHAAPKAAGATGA